MARSSHRASLALKPGRARGYERSRFGPLARFRLDRFPWTPSSLIKTYPDIPILALTASRTEDIEAKVYRAGMNDIVGKPFKPNELKQKIIDYLQMKKE